MQPDEKRELVQRLVEIHTSQDLVSAADLSMSAGKDFSKCMTQKIQQEKIELHLKYFDTEQIRALLDFYDSPMGRSILESQSKIDFDLTEHISIISNDVHKQAVEDIQSEILTQDNNS
jgi:polyhydroxyalkanoate synthesis regulator phasin